MSLSGTFNVTERGAATYSIPISVPPGTAGMEPRLSLDYNSQGGDGLLGMGWALSGLPSIGRCPRTQAQDGVRGAVKYDMDDRFCMEGQRLILVSGSYGADGSEYRTELEGFSKITANGTAGNGPAWFEVRTKPGQVMEFGNTVDSRILAQGKATARSWGVNNISDVKGNYLTVTYQNNGATTGEAYPTRIDYTGNTAASLTPYNSVQFVYGSRGQLSSFHAGSQIRILKRLQNVRVYEGANMVHDYKFTYATLNALEMGATFRERIVAIEWCAGSGACLPKTELDWIEGPGATFSIVVCGWIIFPPCPTTPPPNPDSFVYTSAGVPPNYQAPHPGDFNGNGRTDIFFCQYDSYARCSTTAGNLWLSNGDGTFTKSASNLVPVSNSGVYLGDFNGNGRTDFFFCTRDIYYRCTNAPAHLALSNGDGSFTQFALPNTPANGLPILGDFSGDGRTDIFFCAGDGNHRCNTGITSTWLSNGNGTFSATSSSVIPVAASGVHPGDFDGDGKTDFFICSADSSGRCPAGGTRYMRLSNGNGTFTSVTATLAPTTARGAPPPSEQAGYYRLYVLDANGDGKSDIFFCCSNQSGTFTWLSMGDGVFVYLHEFDVRTGYQISTLGDVNGTGRTDVIWCKKDSLQRCTADALAFGIASGGGFTSLSPSDAPPTNGLVFYPGDFSGNGRTDMFLCRTDQYGRCLDTATSYVFSLGAPTLPAADLLSSFTTGLGVETEITYRPLTDDDVYTKDTDAVYPVVDVQGPIYVVSRVDADDGVGGTYSSEYAYEGAKSDLDGRGFLGFRRHVATDLETNIVQTTDFLQSFPYIGLSSLQTKELGSQTLNETGTSYTATSLGGTRYFVTPSEMVDESFDLDNSAIPAVTTSYTYDAYGNATEIEIATPDGASKTTANTFTNDTTNWWLGRLTATEVTSVVP